MATLAESVISGAQQQAQTAGRSVGDAVQAYHIAAVADNAREQLQVQKDENERNKGNWLASQMANIAKNDGSPEAQKILINSLKTQLPRLMPGMDPNAFDSVMKDADTRRLAGWGAAQAIQGQHVDEHSFGDMAHVFGSPEAAMEWVQKIADNKTKIEQARLGIAGVRQQGVNLQTHTSAVKAVADDTYTKQLLATKQNLENAMSNFQQGGETPQEFQELQQAVRSNLGIKGNSGIDEREGTYLKSLGINADKMAQFLSGKLQNVAKSDPDFAAQVMNVASMEVRNKSAQGLQQIDKNSKRYRTFYQSPGMAIHQPDFDATVEAQKQQFMPQSPSAPVPPAGGGAVGPHGASVIQNGHTYNWNAQTGKYE
jgi:hypothetical protein